MAPRSRIEWTETTWNPVTGCTKISHGCKNCYADRMSRRLQAMGVAKYRDGFSVAVHPSVLRDPLRWRKPRLVFVNSMSDLFHQAVPTAFIDAVFEIMNQASHHTFQVLTKRPARVSGLNSRLHWTPNIWLGTSIESEDWLDRLDFLRDTGARTKFLSLEPLLGPLPRPDAGRCGLGDRRRGVRPGRAADRSGLGARDPGLLPGERRAVLLQAMGRGLQEADRPYPGRQGVGPVPPAAAHMRKPSSTDT